jgi:hypothetical protein
MGTKLMMILPPKGRKYGFPKPYPQNLTHKYTLSMWLVEQGYPAEQIPKDGVLNLHMYEEEWPDNPGEAYAI